MSRIINVQSSQHRNGDGEITAVIVVETNTENGESPQGPITIECPSGSVPDLSCALQIVVQAIEELDLELIEPCPKH
jgi:hypothetical protein